MRLAGSSGLCCFHEKMTSQGPWLDFFLSRMAKNSTRKVSLPLASVPHTGRRNAASYNGLLGTPCPAPRKHTAPIFSTSIARVKAACTRAVHTLRCFWAPAVRPQGSGASWWGNLIVVSAEASCQVIPPVEFASCSTSPSGKCFETSGWNTINASVFPSMWLPPAPCHEKQLTFSMGSTSFPTRKLPCSLIFSKILQRAVTREHTMVLQIIGLSGLSPAPEKARAACFQERCKAITNN